MVCRCRSRPPTAPTRSTPTPPPLPQIPRPRRLLLPRAAAASQGARKRRPRTSKSLPMPRMPMPRMLMPRMPTSLLMPKTPPHLLSLHLFLLLLLRLLLLPATMVSTMTMTMTTATTVPMQSRRRRRRQPPMTTRTTIMKTTTMMMMIQTPSRRAGAVPAMFADAADARRVCVADAARARCPSELHRHQSDAARSARAPPLLPLLLLPRTMQRTVRRRKAAISTTPLRAPCAAVRATRDRIPLDHVSVTLPPPPPLPFPILLFFIISQTSLFPPRLGGTFVQLFTHTQFSRKKQNPSPFQVSPLPPEFALGARGCCRVFSFSFFFFFFFLLCFPPSSPQYLLQQQRCGLPENAATAHRAIHPPLFSQSPLPPSLSSFLSHTHN
eukprot:comp21314_c0_seq3/m.45769 comp21314_c0_seq3/g.45769  ORF comp21314_c0_seq3/g.45769 comp21314_c0_seq3/m.45769 type:complete len:383 (-) comp21314_c0_seq3:10-1158(-)